MALEYYAFLDIAPTADPAEVKRAIFRKRKALAIAKDHHGQEYLNEVSRTLQDPTARAEYDALQQHGDAINAVMAGASHAMETSNWAEAIRLLKQALLLVPDQPIVMNQLALALARQGNFVQANALFNTLVRNHPQTALYWANHGRMLLDLAEMTPPTGATTVSCPHCQGENPLPTAAGLASLTCAACHDAFQVNVGGKRDVLLVDARFRIRKALEIEPYNTGLHMAIAHSYEIIRQFDSAQDLVEQAINADGAEDMQDFDALLYLAQLYAFDRKLERIADVATRVERILPAGETDAREYAGQRFAQAGWQLAHVQAFEAAVPFLEAARRFLPRDEDLAQLLQTCQGLLRAAEEFRLLMKDRHIHDTVKRACGFWLAENAGQFSEEEGKAKFQEVVDKISNMTMASLKSSLERVRTSYPSVYACGDEFFKQLLANIRHAEVEQAAARNNARESSGCSGGLIGGGSLGVIAVIYIIFRIVMAIIRASGHTP